MENPWALNYKTIDNSKYIFIQKYKFKIII